MKKRYALVKFQPFTNALYTYSCDESVKKGNVVSVETSGYPFLQEALVAKIRYLHPWELPVDIEKIKPIIAIVHQTPDNTKFCEDLNKRYSFTPNVDIEKNWIEEKNAYEGQIEGCPFLTMFKHISKPASITIFSNKKHCILEIDVGDLLSENFLCVETYCSSRQELNYDVNVLKTKIQDYFDNKLSIDELEKICYSPNDRPE